MDIHLIFVLLARVNTRANEKGASACDDDYLSNYIFFITIDNHTWEIQIKSFIKCLNDPFICRHISVAATVYSPPILLTPPLSSVVGGFFFALVTF